MFKEEKPTELIVEDISESDRDKAENLVEDLKLVKASEPPELGNNVSGKKSLLCWVKLVEKSCLFFIIIRLICVRCVFLIDFFFTPGRKLFVF